MLYTSVIGLLASVIKEEGCKQTAIVTFAEPIWLR